MITRNTYRTIWILSGFLITVSLSVNAQQSNTFYLMHQVPQSNLLNPAVQIKCRWVVGIPLLASSHLNYSNTAFTYNNLAGTSTWNLEGVANQMHRRDLYSTEAALSLLFIGYRHKDTYYTFNVAERSQLYSVVPGKLASMAVFGNAPYAGDLTRFRALRPGGYYLREYALGLSKVLFPGMTVGIRGKLIFGKAGVYPGSSDMRFSTDENTFDLLMEGDYTLNSSAPITITQDQEGNITDVELQDIQMAEFLLNRGNPGFGIDLGIIYRLTDRIELAASLLDLSVVRWRTDLNNVRFDGIFNYRGVDAGTDLVSFEFLAQMVDSLINSFQAEISNSPYFATIPAQLFLGGTYRLNDRLILGAVSRNVFFRSKLHSSFTVTLQTELADRFLATASLSYLNNSLANVGAGIAYTGRGLQFHLVTDNLIGFFFPFDTRTVNLRAGVNILLGCPGGKRDHLPDSAYGSLPSPPNCSRNILSKSREKKLERAARKMNRR
ncbi:MAG: DUF5723 family protein [Bacteroidales bacterium]